MPVYPYNRFLREKDAMKEKNPKKPDSSRPVEEALRLLKESQLPADLKRAHSETPCPPPEVLERFRRGEMADGEARELGYHLLACKDCAAEILAREKVEEEEDSAPQKAQILIFRRQVLVLAAVAAAILIGITLFNSFLPGGDLLLDASLQGDRGLVREGGPQLARGEQFRIELRLARPACIVVLHEDSQGNLSDVYPQPGSAPLLEGPASRLVPGDEEAWDSSGLELGIHALWIFAAPEPLSPEKRESLKTTLKKILGEVPPRLGGRGDLADEARRRLKQQIRHVLELPFRIE